VNPAINVLAFLDNISHLSLLLIYYLFIVAGMRNLFLAVYYMLKRGVHIPVIKLGGQLMISKVEYKGGG
jgi:hypothetical protein